MGLAEPVAVLVELVLRFASFQRMDQPPLV